MLTTPLETILPEITPLESNSNRGMTFTFDYQLRSLIYYHTEEFTSAQALLQEMQDEGSFAHHNLVPEGGLGESTFYEANASRGVTQMLEVFDRLAKKVSRRLGLAHAELGNLVAVDGSLIEASLSMTWANYTGSKNKAKVHLGFNLNQGIPRKLYLTDGKGAERPFVSDILEPGETGVMDRGYQDHSRFDEWIEEGKHFVARLKSNTQWKVLEELPFEEGGKVFFFAKVQLGGEKNRMKHPVYLVGFRVKRKVYWVATSRTDLTAEQIAFIYFLRWEIEKLFAWWKRHLKVYHLISRDRHGVLLQLLAGLITYLLLALYCYQCYGERKPTIRRLRELRRRIRRETGYVRWLVNITINIEPVALLLFPLYMQFSNQKLLQRITNSGFIILQVSRSSSPAYAGGRSFSSQKFTESYPLTFPTSFENPHRSATTVYLPSLASIML
jgi:hypothetical protein